MKKTLSIIFLSALLLLASCAKDITEGRFNITPEPETNITTTTTTTTTTVPSYESRWPATPSVRQPTPFETDVPTRAPYGCEEGQVRGVDC